MARDLPLPPSAQVILLHVDAPAKPAEGTPCNGCGLCCAVEPCPAGVLLSRRRTGACKALQWSDAERRYLCGLVSAPSRVLPWLPKRLAPLASRLTRRWIASATGCDASLAAETA